MTAFENRERDEYQMNWFQHLGGDERRFAATLYQYNARQEEKRQTLQVFI
jgi:hypothetical protein